ncbi:CFEM domain-containing protein [Aspergillus stella-maris]|uniref:CFEM domain-containing protein n=1 Tax=Aspergillus stella-maris TaxID=1810926 RepID=UPI003CCCEC89
MEEIPSCAGVCLAQSLSSSGCLSVLEFGCICPNEQLLSQIQECAWHACTTKESLTAMRHLYATCNYPITRSNGLYHVVLLIGITTSTLSVGFRIAGRLIGSRLGLDDAVACLFLVCVHHEICLSWLVIFFTSLL